MPSAAAKVKGSSATNGLQTSRFVTSPAAGWPAATHWLPVDSNAPADCVNEKDLQMPAFSEAAEGIRTLDLLHGRQNVRDGPGPQRACKQAVSRAPAGSPSVFNFMPIYGILRTE
jgi:hypothetical protein